MIGLGLPVVLVVVVAVVVLVQSRTSRSRTTATTSTPAGAPVPLVEPTRPGPLEDDLARWVALGFLSRSQADAILAYQRSTTATAAPVVPAGAPARRARVPAIAEALGYLGGMLAVLGLGLVVARYWPDLPTAGRLSISGGGALALLGAGALVHADADPAFARLRGFLWLASAAAGALFAGVTAVDGLGAEEASTVAAAASGTVALHSGLLWWRRERPLQQLAFFAALCVFAGALTAQYAGPGSTGLAVWTVGAGCVYVGLRRVTPTPLLPEAIGVVAVFVGAAITSSDWQAVGLVLGSSSATVMLAAAVVPGIAPDNADQLVLAVVGGIGLLQALPPTLGYFANDAAAATGVATWLLGWCLLWVGSRRLTRVPVAIEMLGGGAILGGSALTWAQWSGAAPVFGLVTAVVLVGLGMLPGQVLLSLFGSVGLLINVPWTIGWFFPGEERAPLLIMVTGALIIGVAVLLARMGGRFRRELTEAPDTQHVVGSTGTDASGHPHRDAA